MIIVWGKITARTDSIDEVLKLSREHVARSRTEPGCLSHDVYQDLEDPLTLVFVERWESREILQTHFEVPDSGKFVQQVRELATSAPTILIYESQEIR